VSLLPEKFYITTPIYYVNSDPHIGSAYTTIVADVIARYKRIMGYDVFFLTGTDEHGQKILQAATQNGEDPQSFCDKLAAKFKNLWKDLNITNDYFIRTTNEDHMRVVQSFVSKMKENGDVYKGKYQGWYCIPCETYWSEEDLDESKICPSCGRELKFIAEDNYFFRLSKYTDKLLKHYEENPDFVQPDFRRNEMLKILQSGLKDLSITRTTFSWGVPMLDDPQHVIYVWVDALINYISAVGFMKDESRFSYYWPADLHLIGKEINRFHSIVWPAMLMSVGLPLPKKVFAHGWLTVNGQKISKSLGNAIDPRFLADKYGNDVVRFYLLRDIVFGKDGDFSEQNLVNRLNADLANNYGNLLHRTTAMIKKHFNSKLPERDLSDSKLVEEVMTAVKSFTHLMDTLQITQALDKAMELLTLANKYFDEKKPWILAKDENKKPLGSVLYNVCEILLKVAVMLAPIMPETSLDVMNRLGFSGDISEQLLSTWGVLKSRNTVKHGKPLFTKIQEKQTKPVANTQLQEDNLISIDEFKKIQLKVGKVLRAEKIPKSKKLLKLIVDLGPLGQRQIIAGIANYYEPQDLLGKSIVVVTNLKPAKLMGLESQGMLLAAKSNAELKILTVDGSIDPGSVIS